jgi:hypothetical protein
MSFFKKLFGLDKAEQMKQDAEKLRAEAAEATKEAEELIRQAKEDAELAKLNPKDRATRKKEPWVGVLETHINKENIRNGFFELDWNKHFIQKLIEEGYGSDGDTEEEIVDRWFRELCANVVVDGDFGGRVETGTIDVQTVKQKNT